MWEPGIRYVARVYKSGAAHSHEDFDANHSYPSLKNNHSHPIANILGGRSLTMLYTMSVDLQLPRDCAGLCDMSMFSLLPFVSAQSQVFTHHRSLRFDCSQASIGIFCGIHLRRQNKEGSSILFVLHLLLWCASWTLSLIYLCTEQLTSMISLVATDSPCFKRSATSVLQGGNSPRGRLTGL